MNSAKSLSSDDMFDFWASRKETFYYYFKTSSLLNNQPYSAERAKSGPSIYPTSRPIALAAGRGWANPAHGRKA